MRNAPQQCALLRSLVRRNCAPVFSGRCKAREWDELFASARTARRAVKPALSPTGTPRTTAAPSIADDPLTEFVALPVRGKQPVLIVLEDDSQDFVSLKRALWKLGATARVWWARNATDALELLRELECRSWKVCVLASLQAPGADLGLAKSVKSRNGEAQVRCAFITHPAGRSLADQAYAAGADAFFVKPAAPEAWSEIAHAVRTLTL